MRGSWGDMWHYVQNISIFKQKANWMQIDHEKIHEAWIPIKNHQSLGFLSKTCCLSVLTCLDCPGKNQWGSYWDLWESIHMDQLDSVWPLNGHWWDTDEIRWKIWKKFWILWNINSESYESSFRWSRLIHLIRSMDAIAVHAVDAVTWP